MFAPPPEVKMVVCVLARSAPQRTWADARRAFVGGYLERSPIFIFAKKAPWSAAHKRSQRWLPRLVARSFIHSRSLLLASQHPRTETHKTEVNTVPLHTHPTNPIPKDPSPPIFPMATALWTYILGRPIHPVGRGGGRQPRQPDARSRLEILFGRGPVSIEALRRELSRRLPSLVPSMILCRG